MSGYKAQRGWPTKSCDLLLRASLCEPEIAKQSWNQWSNEFGLNKASWAEVRLLASVAKKFPEPALQGIRKFIWVQTQMQFVPTLSGLNKLSQNNINLLLMKGVARIAVDPTVASERLVRDLDVLVSVDQAEKALALLMKDGWELSEWQKLQRKIDPITSHHAWSVNRGSGEIDLHHFSNFLNRDVGIDSGLWNRSNQIQWNGLHVHIPSATDGLLLSIIHGIRWSKEKSADWVLDAAGYLNMEIQWDTVEQEAKKRQMDLVIHAGLTYLRERIGLKIPDDIIDALNTTESAAKERLFFYAYVAHQPVLTYL